MRTGVKVAAVLLLAVLTPGIAFAQASISGTVRDTSGAVLPGVTVDASSAALIERTRSVVTDGTGQYRVVDLRPGTYSVTFTLPGFATVKRDGIELAGSFTATVNIELSVGELAESITVSGQSPTVDVQSTTTQRVLSNEVIDALPTGRQLTDLGLLVPGVNAAGNQNGAVMNTGGAIGDQMGALTAHGSRRDGSQTTMNGMNVSAISGFVGGRSSNMGAVQEVVLDTGGVSAEAAEGGPRVNMIPREGGNQFAGTFFGSFANDALQGSNLSDDLVAAGLPVPNSVDQLWDFNPGFGGPIARDKLWFYSTFRHTAAKTFVGAGVFEDRNANNPNAWTYDPDPARPGISAYTWIDAQTRLTWQASEKNKLAFAADVQKRSGPVWVPGDITAPEAQTHQQFPQITGFIGEWTAPVTSRLLLQAGASRNAEGFHHPIHDDAVNVDQLVSVIEQSTGRMYKRQPIFRSRYNQVFYPRLSVSYVTGAHALKVGYNDAIGFSRERNDVVGAPLQYRFNNSVPNQITQFALPYPGGSTLDHNTGVFAQDKWTIKRATVNLGLRFDWIQTSYSELSVGPGPLVPNRNLSFPKTPFYDFKDVTPRVGVAYDVFGNGRTALRASLNKYLQGGLTTTAGVPAGNLVTSTTRSWTDGNRNYVPECDLLIAAGNGECGALANPNFGTVVPGLTYDPEAIAGWGNRNYNWEFSVGVQQEVAPRVAVDVAYFRRWYGNFTVTDNRSVSAADYDTFSITVPQNSLLPEGGGYTVSGLYDLKPSSFGLPAQNYQTLNSAYGDQIEQFDGIDVSMNARLQNGVLVQGGFATGKRVMDNCDVVSQVPEMLFNVGTLTYGTIGNSWLPASFCRQETGLETQVKLLGVYTVPRIEVQVSGTFQSSPGPLVFGRYVATNAVVMPSLGRPLSGGAQNITVDIVDPGTMYGDRVNQVDLRIGKIMRFAGLRTAVNVDVYNVLNQNPVLVESPAYATFRRPLQIMMARFAKLSVNLDF